MTNIFFLLLFFLTSIIAYAQGPIAKYEFNGNANDLVGANHGTVSGASLVADRFGRPNRAYAFDGIDDYIEIVANDILNFAYNDDFSITLWVKIAATQNDLDGHNNEILGKWDPLNSTGYPYAIRFWNELAVDENKNRIFNLRYDSPVCSNNPTLTGSCMITREEWHYLAFVKKDSLLTYYQDGDFFGTTIDNTSSSCTTKNNNPIYIGKRDSNRRYFTGVIDDIAFYDRALPHTEMWLLMQEGAWQPPQNPEYDILSFNILGRDSIYAGFGNNIIEVIMPCNTDLSILSANLFLAAGHEAYVDNVLQELSTVNDFTNPLVYVITDGGICQEEWLVTTSLREYKLGDEEEYAAFNSFFIPGQIGSTNINTETHEIEILMPCPVDLTSLVPQFKEASYATVYVSGIIQVSDSSAQDFTSAVNYFVEAGNSCGSLNWLVKVRNQDVGEVNIDEAASFMSFSIPGQIGLTEINSNTHEIDIVMPCESELTNLVPQFQAANYTTVYVDGLVQESSASVHDFTNPVTYFIEIDKSCGAMNWQVNVSNQAGRQTNNDEMLDFLNYSVQGQIGASEINDITNEVIVYVPCNIDIKQIISSFELPNNSMATINGVAQESSSSANNFTYPREYIISTTNGCLTTKWHVEVVLKEVATTAIDINSMEFFIPNIITPNGDGKNETFNIGESLIGSSLSIYNRYGIKVYTAKNYQNSFSGASLSAGTYYYTIKSKCFTDMLNGALGILH